MARLGKWWLIAPPLAAPAWTAAATGERVFLAQVADHRFSLVLPLLACATATTALISMAITRSPALASSHRYVGATSLPVAKVGWQLVDDGRVLEADEGHAVYCDDRPPASGEKGPVRLMCEILDYRYARYVSGDAEMIHPFIHRGLWRDVQVWLPAIEYSAPRDGGRAAALRRPTMVPVVLKVYPLVGWLWLGLGLALGGAAIRLVATLCRS